ncbi:MAG: rRNA processing protein [Geoglossum umbratile]|nr:MAG: rRNA processing protein [Geoglossum umbratile]
MIFFHHWRFPKSQSLTLRVEQKPKLKVGKAKPKAANFTDTSFKARCKYSHSIPSGKHTLISRIAIVLSQQSLSTSAPAAASQFSHHVSLLTHHSSSHRRDSLAHLTSTIRSLPIGSPLPQPLSTFLPKLLPLILDASSSVRSQLLGLLKALPQEEIAAHTDRILLFVQSAMTHLAADIRSDSTGFLEWALDVIGEEAVSSSLGWVKTTKCFIALLGWERDVKMAGGVGRATFSKAGEETKTIVKHLQVFSQFLTVGLLPTNDVPGSPDDAMDTELTHYQTLISTNLLLPNPTTPQHLIPKTSNCYAHLNLFTVATTGTEIIGMAEDCEARRRELRPYVKIVERGLEEGKKGGGLVGRAASTAQKLLARGMIGEAGEEEGGSDDDG